MNKADLIAKITDDTGVGKVQVNAVLDSFVDCISKALQSGEKVTLVGFGTFIVSNHKERTGRNPKTNESIRIKAKKVARFKSGKELSAML